MSRRRTFTPLYPGMFGEQYSQLKARFEERASAPYDPVQLELSQRKLAELLGISPASLSEYLSGMSMPIGENVTMLINNTVALYHVGSEERQALIYAAAYEALGYYNIDAETVGIPHPLTGNTPER